MKSMRWWLCALIVLAARATPAGNLVPNGSFETYTDCPPTFSLWFGPGSPKIFLIYAVPWTYPTVGTSDYFNACPGPGSYVYVPANLFGNQAARTGSAYAGIHAGVPHPHPPPPTFGMPDPNYREYVEVPLCSPLIAGESYDVSFYVSLADFSSYATSRMGAYLSVGSTTNNSIATELGLPAQIENPPGNILADTTGWTLISGTYLAAGGEDHLTIGNFYDDANSAVVPQPPSSTPLPYSYYYIDDVKVLSEPGPGYGQGCEFSIAFESARDGNFEVYVMDSNGSNQTNVTNHPANDRRPTWSHDESQIAFFSDRDGNNEIYVIDADGSNPTNLTTTPRSDTSPNWSHDGSQIAFVSERDSSTYGLVNFEIYRMESDGSNPTRLTLHPASDLSPEYSPDGSRIAFESNRDGNFEIYTMDAVDGSNLTRLTVDPASDRHPAWSPDGTQIAFSSDRDGNFEIYRMNADGTNPTRILGLCNSCPGPGTDSAPAWSADGTQIYFTSDRDVDREVFVMDADGSNQTNLTQGIAMDAFPAPAAHFQQIGGNASHRLPALSVGARIALVLLLTGVVTGAMFARRGSSHSEAGTGGR